MAQPNYLWQNLGNWFVSLPPRYQCLWNSDKFPNIPEDVRKRDARHATFFDEQANEYNPPWNHLSDILLFMTYWKEMLPDEARDELPQPSKHGKITSDGKILDNAMLQPVAVIACAIMDAAYTRELDVQCWWSERYSDAYIFIAQYTWTEEQRKQWATATPHERTTLCFSEAGFNWTRETRILPLCFIIAPDLPKVKDKGQQPYFDQHSSECIFTPYTISTKIRPISKRNMSALVWACTRSDRHQLTLITPSDNLKRGFVDVEGKRWDWGTVNVPRKQRYEWAEQFVQNLKEMPLSLTLGELYDQLHRLYHSKQQEDREGEESNSSDKGKDGEDGEDGGDGGDGGDKSQEDNEGKEDNK